MIDSNVIDKVKKLQEEIQKAVTQKAVLEGKLESLTENLKKEFNIDSFDNIDTELQLLDKNIVELESDIIKDLLILKTDYNFEV